MDKKIWIELQRFYNKWKEETQNSIPSDFEFDSLDGKRHIVMYQTDGYSDDGELEWYIEVNEIGNGRHILLDNTFSPVNDEACLMVQIAWCIENFW